MQTFLLWLCTFKLSIATSAVFLTLALLFFFLAGGVSARVGPPLSGLAGRSAVASRAATRPFRFAWLYMGINHVQVHTQLLLAS